MSTPAPDPDLLTALTVEASMEVTHPEDDTASVSEDTDG